MSQGMPSEHVLLYQGKALDHDRLKYAWRATKKALGFGDSPAGYYSLKHLGNSVMDLLGVDASVRRDLTRHSSTRMVQDVYRLEIPGEVKASLTKFDSDLRRYANATD